MNITDEKMYFHESNEIYMKREAIKMFEKSSEQRNRKFFNNKINNEVSFFDESNCPTEEGSPFDPLFKFYRFIGLSFLGRKSMDDSRITKKWLLILEIILFLMTILLTIYWNVTLLIDPGHELMGQSTIGQIVLPAFLFNLELSSCLLRLIINFKFDEFVKMELFLFDLVEDKESVFRKLKKVVKNITIISSIIFCLPFVYGAYNLFITRRNNPNDNYIVLSIKFILYVFHAYMSKFEIIHS